MLNQEKHITNMFQFGECSFIDKESFEREIEFLACRDEILFVSQVKETKQ